MTRFPSSLKPIMTAFPIATALAISLSAQANDSALSESHQLMEITITASPFGRTSDEMVQPTLLLTGETLDNKRQATIGQTLSQELGLANSDFGQGAGRPVIRGQAGPRVEVLSNTVGAMDVSNLSPDHAVAINPLIARQIEVLKGPATLLYGNGAIGGVVNVSDSRLVTEITPGWSGAMEASAGTVARENQVSADVNYGKGAHQLHLDVTQTRSDDYRIPGNSHVDGSGSNKRLPNSDTELQNGAMAYNYVDDNGNSAGIALSRYENRYGLPNEEAAFIDMKQQRLDSQVVLRNPAKGLESLKFRAGSARYDHIEFEAPGEPGTRFKNDEYQARVEAVHQAIAGFRGVVGVQFGHREFSAIGDEAYVPNVTTRQGGLFIIEERQTAIGKLELGARIDQVRHEPDAGLPARQFTPVSLSAGTVYAFNEHTHLKASLTHAERAPATEELYANGPHIATGTFETGNATLKKERALNIDVGFDHHVGSLTFEANAFHKRVRDYIYGQDVGTTTNVDGEDFADLNYQQQNANFRGVEGAVTWALVDTKAKKIDARIFADAVRGELADNQAVPRMPPYRVGVSLHGHQGPLSGNISLTHADRQTRISGANETDTGSHNLLNADISYTLATRVGLGKPTLFLRGTNLLNDDVRRSTSFIKDVAPAPGRGAVMGVRINF